MRFRALLLAVGLFATGLRAQTVSITAPAALPNGTVNSPYPVTTFTATPPANYAWTAVGLPAGLSLSSSGVLSGTATQTVSATTILVTATNHVAGTSGVRTYSLTITPVAPAPLSLSPSSLTPWTAGQPYSAQLAAVGGIPSYTFADAGVPPTLPSWLALSGSSLTGTPPLPGGTTYSFSIRVTDSTGASSTRGYALQINAPLTAMTSSLAATTSGSSYTQPLTASTGTGPLTWSGSGLPSWLTVSGANLTGIAPIVTTPTTYNFSLTVTDAAGASISRPLSVTVNPIPVNQTPVILSATPNTGQQGQTLTNVAVEGQGTNFINGTTAAGFGAGITVNSTVATDSTHATVSVTIAANAPVGPRDVTMFTGSEVATLANGFTVVAGQSTPLIQTVTPNTGHQGQSLTNVVVVGQGTNFVNGLTLASFGAGITVNSTAVTDATHATVSITIAANAAAGARTVTVATGSEVAALQSGFTVSTVGPPVIQSVTPNVAQPGQSLASVAVVGQDTNFVNGSTVAGAGAGVTVNSVVVTDSTHATLSLTVSSTAAAGPRTVTLTTGSEVAAMAAGLVVTVNPDTPVILSATPNTAQPGQSLVSVAVTGQFTNFVNGTTTASFGAGITVNSTSVTDATHATVAITIAANTTTGPRTVILTTGSEVAQSASGFAIIPNGTPAVIQTVAPDTAQPGQIFVSVTVVGQGTHFVDGTTVADFGAGITVTSTSVADATHAAVTLIMAGNSTGGARTVTMTTGSEVAVLQGGFTVVVNTGTPIILTVTGNTGQQEQGPVNVDVVGQFTNFANGRTVADFGPGITVNSTTVTDRTHANVSLAIAVNAFTGRRTVTLTTGLEVATSAAGFAVNPAVTITNPSDLAPWTEGRPYSLPLAATGGTGPYIFSDPTGSLPAWLVLTGSTLSGTPPSPGGTAYSFAIRAIDAVGANNTKVFTLLINKPPAVSSSSLPATTSGVGYGVVLSATGGTSPLTWSVSGLPTWMTLSGASLSGNAPVVAVPTPFSFDVSVTDGTGATSHTTVLGTINPPVTIVTASGLPAATATRDYATSLVATGGTGQVLFSLVAGGLPPGLALSAEGQLSGTPAEVTQPTDFQFQVSASDSLKSSYTREFFLTVNPPPLTISTATLNPGTAGLTYSVALTAVGGVRPYTWTLASGVLPTGMQLDPTTGLLSGRPTEGGTFPIGLSVTDKLGAKLVKSFSLTIVSNLKVTNPLTRGSAGAGYSLNLQSTGANGIVSWSITQGSLPDGVSLDAVTGVISGIPGQVGTFDVRVRAQDASGVASSLAVTLVIDPATIPAVSITGLDDQVKPAQQVPIALTLSAGFPLEIRGRLTVTFTPNPSVGVVDPMVQFANGTSVDFRIPANSTQAIFSQLSTLQTGSLAGKISLDAVFQAGGATASTTSPSSKSGTAPLLPPVILGTPTFTRTGNAIQISLNALSTTRKVTSATYRFSFTAASHQAPVDVIVPLDAMVSAWYATPASLAVGSQFGLTQSFSVNGDINQLTGVSITIANDQGTSQAANVSF